MHPNLTPQSKCLCANVTRPSMTHLLNNDPQRTLDLLLTYLLTLYDLLVLFLIYFPPTRN